MRSTDGVRKERSCNSFVYVGIYYHVLIKFITESHSFFFVPSFLSTGHFLERDGRYYIIRGEVGAITFKARKK